MHTEIKIKLLLGEKLSISESQNLLEELKANKYVDLLIKQKDNLLIIIDKFNKAKKNSRSSLNGGSGNIGLNYFSTDMIDIVSKQLEDLDNEIASIAELESNYWAS